MKNTKDFYNKTAHEWALNGYNDDRDFYYHTLNELKESTKNLFEFIKEIPNTEPIWKNYFFKKTSN